MDYYDYWLLDSVVRTPFPLALLPKSRETVTGAFNRPFHDMDYNTLTKTLTSLWSNRLLRFFSLDDWLENIVFDASVINRLFDPDLEMYYGLTEEGGAVWEHMSSADWSKYCFIEEGDEMVITAGALPVAEHYLQLQSTMGGGFDIINSSINWSIIKPWRATYWKTLATGWSVRFRTAPTLYTPVSPMLWRQWSDLQTWYTNPFSPPQTKA
jgi:hypothetical protein